MTPPIVKPYYFDRDAEVIALLHKVFSPWVGDEQYFDWKYKQFSDDECSFPNAWIIEQDGRIVAFNGYLVRRIYNGSDFYWGAQSFDTASDPACRGQGLFGALQDQVYEAMKEHNVKWVYGWTSEMGFHVFTKKVGWEVWGRQNFLMKALNPRVFMNRNINNQAIASAASLAMSSFNFATKPRSSSTNAAVEQTVLDGDLSYLSDKSKLEFNLIAERTIDYINWRVANPMNPLELIVLKDGDLIRGYVAYRIDDGELDIYDFLSDSQDTSKQLLIQLESVGKREQADMVRFRINRGHQYTRHFKRYGYFWSKSEFPLLGRALDANYSNPNDVASMHWSVFDRNE